MLPIQGLPSNSTCNVFGWGQQFGLHPRNEVTSIYSSEFCNPDLPLVSCSTFTSITDPICSAMLGSPILCDSNTRFAGLVTSERCVGSENNFFKNMQSVHDFGAWYQKVLRIQNSTTPYFMREVVEYIPDFTGSERFRCVATIINENHFLTTATCVLLPQNTQLAIGLQELWNQNQINEVDDIFVHGDFVPGNPRTANIAVIRVSYLIKYEI